MSLIRSLIKRPPAGLRATAGQPLPFDEWISYFNFGNVPLYMSTSLNGKEEQIIDSFAGLIQGAYRSNGVVFACELARIMLFSEARFQFRQRRSGRPGELFGTNALRPLERPWRGATTGDLLTRALQHADYGGTAFIVRRGDRLRLPRPDWVTMVLGSENDPDVTGEDLDADLLGILYHPGGRYSGKDPVSILAEDVAVFAPIPDPTGKFRGIPWPAVVTRNIMSHNAATTHKLKFFENGATPQVVVSLDAGITDPIKFRQWVEVLEQDHKGATNAYKTLYLGAGAQADVVGANLRQLDFKATQGADETLIAAAAGVPPVIVGISEGLQGSSLNSGNYASSFRRFADLFARPTWRNFSGSVETIIDTPTDAELWYDDRDVPALKDDIKDAAEVQAREAQSIRTLLDAGWTPESVQDAVISGDWRRLEHSGLFSVQLQPPGSESVSEPQQVLAQALAASITQLTATKPTVPLLASGAEFEVRCTGTRKDGTPCNALVGKRASPNPVGFESKCDRCGAIVAA